MLNKPLISVVVIGRNEGQRLMRCFDSVHRANWADLDYELIYVDSRSEDDSIACALAHDARSIEMQDGQLSAARARNLGLCEARGNWVLFLDGDTLLDSEFVQTAFQALQENAKLCAVWGHRREINIQGSIYNRVLDLDWVYAPGQTDYCGGDALFRKKALDEVQGFNEHLIAGEEPEMCRRLRAAGWAILHIDAPMTGHDLAIHRFSQYWRRAERAGYAYSLVSSLFENTTDPLWLQQMRRNYQQAAGILIYSLALLSALFLQPALGLGLAVPVLAALARSTYRNQWKSKSWGLGLLYAAHSYFQKLPIAWGQLTFWWAQSKGRRRSLIEYKA